MDMLVPIGLGFILHSVVFSWLIYFTKNKAKSLAISTIFFSIVLLSSFFIGSWLGMGFVIISLGMLFSVVITGLFTAISINNAQA